MEQFVYYLKVTLVSTLGLKKEKQQWMFTLVEIVTLKLDVILSSNNSMLKATP